MAHVDSKGMVRGTAGSVVYRSYRNKNIIQGKPRKFKQTQGSIKASTEFGLSSSAAAVIRRAFEPAYIHRDGGAVSRSTQLVYKSLRNSPAACVCQRDLHDANLQDLVGLEFNRTSELSEVLQLSHTASRTPDGNLQVNLGRFNPSEDTKKAAGYPKKASRYRIRLMAIAFDFRKEYLEYLDMKDIDVNGWEIMQEQTIILKGQEDPGCLVLLSMSLLMYDQINHTREYVLLNNKGFSPCAIIAAFQSKEPSEKTADPISLSEETYPKRYKRMQEMGYAGNALLKKAMKRLQRAPGRSRDKENAPEVSNISFRKKCFF